MLSPGCGGGAKSKGALYRETLQTTGFYVGRIVNRKKRFAAFPSPATPLPQVPGIFPECVWGGMRNLSVRWGSNQFPKRSAVPPPVGRPRGCGGRTENSL